MPTIVPAILEESKEKFLVTYSIATKIPGVERIQVDFADGKFLPNVLLDVDEINALNPTYTWEAHLMCKEPKDFLEYQICGFKVVVVHFEAYASAVYLENALEEIKKLGLKAGVALNPETPVSVLKSFENKADQFLLMGVQPGRQGSKFIPETLGRIKELRKIMPNAIIEVDGGVNETNIKSIKEAGADLIVAGSAIVKSENPKEAFEKLNAKIS